MTTPTPSPRDLLAEALHAHASGGAGCWPICHDADWYFEQADAILASPALDAIVAERVAVLADYAEWAIKAARPHVPPSTDRNRTRNLAARIAYNHAARIARRALTDRRADA